MATVIRMDTLVFGANMKASKFDVKPMAQDLRCSIIGYFVELKSTPKIPAPAPAPAFGGISDDLLGNQIGHRFHYQNRSSRL